MKTKSFCWRFFVCNTKLLYSRTALLFTHICIYFRENVSRKNDNSGTWSDNCDLEELEVEVENGSIDKKATVCGRRLVNVANLFNKLQQIEHMGFGCTFKELELVSEQRIGIVSCFNFKCKMCRKIEKIWTEDEDLDTVAVSGALSVGIGYSQTEELFSSLDIPFMSNQLYQKCNKKLSANINTNLWDTMQQAAAEEKQFAIESGNVDEKGIPIITVVADGAWSKRSYRTNYNALSGVASIIGARTQ